ncbi:MFS transporter [Microlunatus sp. GCM10028923]|uniref:MFS transporter n=1 Tax=Microlunatus sp. GCM10028923 TaxID=3273400 RepID=UPI0036102E40
MVPMLAAVALLGLADSMTGSYLVLFATGPAGLMPVQVGVLSSVISLGGIAASAYFGRRFDRAPTRGFLAVACVAGAVGYALMPQVPHFVALLLVGLTLVGAVGAGYPQLFALAAVIFADSVRRRAAPILRSGWSLAWAVGPIVAAALLLVGGYTGLFRASAIALLLTAAVLLAVPSPGKVGQRSAETESESRPGRAVSRTASSAPSNRRMIGTATASMILVHCAMFAGSIALPLYVTEDLHRPEGEVGLLFSACAVVEIVAALVLVWLLPRVPLPMLILSGFLLFAGYFVITVVAQGITALLLAQLARGGAIAVIGTAGLQYFQSLGKGTVGATTALFSNAATAGSLVSGLLAGALVQWFGTTVALGCCGLLSLTAGVVFLAGRRRGPGVRTHPDR